MVSVDGMWNVIKQSNCACMAEAAKTAGIQPSL